MCACVVMCVWWCGGDVDVYVYGCADGYVDMNGDAGVYAYMNVVYRWTLLWMCMRV